jgi:hypothetical protein
VSKSPASFQKISKFWQDYPLVIAVVVCVISGALLVQAWASSQGTAELAIRVHQQYQRAQTAAAVLTRVMPEMLTDAQVRIVRDLLGKGVATAGGSDKNVRAIYPESLGQLAGVQASHGRLRVELAGLTLKQLGTVINTMESSGLPLWIESIALSAAQDGSQSWNATLDFAWIGQGHALEASAL